MSKSDGFTLVEVIIASSILMMIVTTLVPIFTILKNERAVLSDRRTIAYQLHDNLQTYIWDSNVPTPASFTETIQFNTVAFDFTMENELIKGCANWKNVKKIKETICLYGIPQK